MIIENEGESPVRTLVVYTHMESPDYTDLPNIIKVGNSLHEFNDLEKLWERKELPVALNEYVENDLAPSNGRFIFFDPRKQDRS